MSQEHSKNPVRQELKVKIPGPSSTLATLATRLPLTPQGVSEDYKQGKWLKPQEEFGKSLNGDHKRGHQGGEFADKRILWSLSGGGFQLL